MSVFTRRVPHMQQNLLTPSVFQIHLMEKFEDTKG
jgi:hypothetical protein